MHMAGQKSKTTCLKSSCLLKQFKQKGLSVEEKKVGAWMSCSADLLLWSINKFRDSQAAARD